MDKFTKSQLRAMLNEVIKTIDSWNDEIFKKEILKEEMTFVYYPPVTGNDAYLERYKIKVRIEK